MLPAYSMMGFNHFQRTVASSTAGATAGTEAYPDYQLHVTMVTNENSNQTKIYTDKLGRTILESVQADATEWLKTVYVYDDLGRLAYAISPEGVKTGNLSPNQAFLDQWAFQYRYDALGRLVEHKAPAGGWLYTVYDKLNRPVLTQNADQRTRNEWAFAKYDAYGRPVVTGYKVITSSTRLTVQASVDTQAHQYELSANNAVGYSLNRTYPAVTDSDLLSVGYFDNYTFLSYSAWDVEALNYNFVPEQGSTSYNAAVQGLPTGGKIRVVGTNTWLNAVQYYDKWYRPLQIIAENHLGGIDRNTNKYNSLRQLTETRMSHHNGSVIVLAKMTYDHSGRLTEIYQNINNAPSDQLVVQYEYNALGQLVDKKLHNISGSQFLQSIDYRYNIRGWLKSINNAALNVNTQNNDDANDYFGMELLYNTTEAGLNDQSGDEVNFNGNISAVMWKGFGHALGLDDRRSYKYKYDHSGRLLGATSATFDSTSWAKDRGAWNELMTYDQNGNIKTLDRRHRKHILLNGLPAYGAEAMDSLVYTYGTVEGNQLRKVEDAISAAIGEGDFKNGVSSATEYTYNGDGSLTGDLNKGIDTVQYNVLGKVSRVHFSDGRSITYLYDAGGNKLKMTVQDSVQFITDYVGGFVYENNALKFFGSPEGRIVKNESVFEYQYAIADNQGNTRLVFTSAAPAPDAPLATFEGDSGDDSDQYLNVDPAFVVASVAANHTTPGNTVIRMNQTYKVGPSKSLHVFPGDKVDIKVWEYHEGSSSFGTSSTATSVLVNLVATAFGGVSGGGGESGAIYTGVDEAVAVFGKGGNQGTERPAAYLNYILFDKNYNVLNAGWQLAPATTFTKQELKFSTMKIDQEGYMFVYLSYDNDSPNWVYFDDFNVTHTKSNVIQYNEYYPFGLQTEESWTRADHSNKFLYNGGSELNTTSGWYETFFRGYDAALGRFNQVDPMAFASSGQSPYNFAFNDPVLYNDPNGDYPENTYVSMPYQWDTGWGGEGGGGGGSQYLIGPGSGNHWSDQYGGVERNARMMSMSTFNSEYRIQNDKDRARVAAGAYAPSNEAGAYSEAIAKFLGGAVSPNGQYIVIEHYERLYLDGIHDKHRMLESTWIPIGAQQGDYQVLQSGMMSDYGGPSLELLVGASAYRIAKNIEASKGWWKGKQAWGEKWKVNNPRVKIRLPGKNFSVSGRTAMRTVIGLKVFGGLVGAYGLYHTYGDYASGKISGGEAALDAAFGVIGFLGPWGMAASATYFLAAKPLYNYITDDGN